MRRTRAPLADDAPTRLSPRDVEILHRGHGFAAIAKPPGFAVAAERNKPKGYATPLLDAAAKALGQERILVVHRLDRDTSGVMLLAWDVAAHRALSMAFQERRVEKRYWVIARGEAPREEGVIDAPLEPDPGDASKMRVARGQRAGKRSLTRWRVLERFRGYTLVEAAPETGRMHQIRVHLAHAGLPLAVDPQYGGAPGIFLSDLKRGYKPPRDREEPAIIGRLTLHARSLALDAPSGPPPASEPAPVPGPPVVALSEPDASSDADATSEDDDPSPLDGAPPDLTPAPRAPPSPSRVALPTAPVAITCEPPKDFARALETLRRFAGR